MRNCSREKRPSNSRIVMERETKRERKVSSPVRNGTYSLPLYPFYILGITPPIVALGTRFSSLVLLLDSATIRCISRRETRSQLASFPRRCSYYPPLFSFLTIYATANGLHRGIMHFTIPILPPLFLIKQPCLEN